MERIVNRADLIALAEKMGLGGSWHEPDQQNVTATVEGSSFDNAGFWPEDGCPSHHMEQHVILKQDGKPVAAVNLATLFAWATGYEG